MTLQQLRYVIAVADHGSMNEAAKALFISQPSLSGAVKELEKELSKVELSGLKIPYVTNVTAQYVTDAESVKPLLEKQVSSSVRWQQSVEMMIADGVDTFIEIGPGKTLSGFMKKINRNVTVLNIEKMEDVEACAECLQTK